MMSRQRGMVAEEHAHKFLVQHGLRLVKQNFYSRFGEIDLIMQDNDTLVFVEVRKRQQGFTQALESITSSKQQKLVKAASYYLLKLGREVNCRFDAVVIDGQDNCKWLKNVIVG